MYILQKYFVEINNKLFHIMNPLLFHKEIYKRYLYLYFLYIHIINYTYTIIILLLFLIIYIFKNRFIFEVQSYSKFSREMLGCFYEVQSFQVGSF
jgi:hypothetical protein